MVFFKLALNGKKIVQKLELVESEHAQEQLQMTKRLHDYKCPPRHSDKSFNNFENSTARKGVVHTVRITLLDKLNSVKLVDGALILSLSQYLPLPQMAQKCFKNGQK